MSEMIISPLMVKSFQHYCWFRILMIIIAGLVRIILRYLNPIFMVFSFFHDLIMYCHMVLIGFYAFLVNVFSDIFSWLLIYPSLLIYSKSSVLVILDFGHIVWDSWIFGRLRFYAIYVRFSNVTYSYSPFLYVIDDTHKKSIDFGFRIWINGGLSDIIKHSFWMDEAFAKLERQFTLPFEDSFSYNPCCDCAVFIINSHQLVDYGL